ncbi:hypothetical protein CU044_0837 [Streptomyces sp. L-9-10]|uniref:hypothetical protein n=1 Tax=unclassified Streptomyces TaxID=2593676 RepID=UPI00101DCBC8|nr:hypothetical protein [Streptomyces sp. L-9-10]RYJ30787.1 hypothetical protein CU044_0837 [Streptomyces sp. L-9-10]
METTTVPTPTPEQTTDRGALLALRLWALGGLGLLLGGYVLLAVIALTDAVDPGDGVAGAYISAGFWSLHLSGLIGLAAAALPGGSMLRGVRSGAVGAQYVLLAAGPVLALMD